MNRKGEQAEREVVGRCGRLKPATTDYELAHASTTTFRMRADLSSWAAPSSRRLVSASPVWRLLVTVAAAGLVRRIFAARWSDGRANAWPGRYLRAQSSASWAMSPGECSELFRHHKDALGDHVDPSAKQALQICALQDLFGGKRRRGHRNKSVS